MARRFTRSTLLPAMAAFGLILHGPLSTARADLPPEAYVGVYLYTDDVPADGAIRGYAQLLEGADWTLTVVSLTGEDVSGEVVWSGSTFIFFPDESLEPGQYFVRIGELESEPLSVVEATGELPLITETNLRELPSGAGRAVRCGVYAEGVEGAVLFYENTFIGPALELRIEGLYADQYNYVIQIDGELPQLLIGPLNYQHLFDASALASEDEVCFEANAIPLRGAGGGSLGPRTCLSTAGLSLGETEEVFGEAFEEGQPRDNLGTCLVPPVGYEGEWCELFSEAFASQSCDIYNYDALGPCMSARETCESGDLFGLHQEKEADSCPESAPQGGCSVASAPCAPGPSAWYFAGLSFLFARFGMRRWRSVSQRSNRAP